MKSLKSMSDKRFDAICQRSLLLGIFIIKWFVAFSLMVLGTLKKACFLPLKNNSVTKGLNFFIRFHICYYTIEHY